MNQSHTRRAAMLAAHLGAGRDSSPSTSSGSHQTFGTHPASSSRTNAAGSFASLPPPAGDAGDRYFVDYDVDAPPARTSPWHVRFVLLSDTHSTQPHVPEGDVVLHAGDLTDLGTVESLQQQIAWLDGLPHKVKIIIGGNHDFSLDNRKGWYDTKGVGLHQKYGKQRSDPVKAAIAVRSATSVVYLEDEAYMLDVQTRAGTRRQWNVWGSPWSPMFGGWAWNYERGDKAKKLYAGVPRNTDVLLTHTPPHAIGGLDLLQDGKTSVGCEALAQRIEERALRPRIHVFGHIHESRGVHCERWKDAAPGDCGSTVFANASIVEFDVESWRRHKRWEYLVRNKPIIVDLDSRV